MCGVDCIFVAAGVLYMSVGWCWYVLVPTVVDFSLVVTVFPLYLQFAPFSARVGAALC